MLNWIFELKLFSCIEVDLALNDPQCLISHGTKLNQTKLCFLHLTVFKCYIVIDYSYE